MSKYAGYLECLNRKCSRYKMRKYLITEAEVDSYFPPKGQIPQCPECKIGMALWDRGTQAAFNKVFHL